MMMMIIRNHINRCSLLLILIIQRLWFLLLSRNKSTKAYSSTYRVGPHCTRGGYWTVLVRVGFESHLHQLLVLRVPTNWFGFFFFAALAGRKHRQHGFSAVRRRWFKLESSGWPRRGVWPVLRRGSPRPPLLRHLLGRWSFLQTQNHFKPILSWRSPWVLLDANSVFVRSLFWLHSMGLC